MTSATGCYGPGTRALRRDQLIRGPAWLESERFDLEAKVETDRQSMPRTEMHLMLQDLLEDRFQLKVHRETRELPVYHLVRGKDGPNIKSSEDQTPELALTETIICSSASAPPAPRQRVSLTGKPNAAGLLLTLTATATSLPNFVNLIESYTGRPVIDKTDLQGRFDFKLEFEAAGAFLNPAIPLSGPGNPSIFTAIQDLGLKLESGKAPIEVLVIDSCRCRTRTKG